MPFPTKICFVCRGNTCRSQIAEGLARELVKKLNHNHVEIYSCGSHPAGFIHPKTIEVMKEEGIDISKQHSKGFHEIPMGEMDYIITLCDIAEPFCPNPKGGGQKLHWPFEDPVLVLGDDEMALKAHRKARDGIKVKLEKWLKKTL